MRGVALAVALALAASAAAAEPGPPPRIVALVIGANQAVDRELPRLRYADDDAARYLELFEAMGAEVAVLADLDANTARLHPRAAVRAAPATTAALGAAVDRLAAEVAAARRAGRPTILYLSFAGHGAVEREVGYLALRDGRLTSDDLAERVVARIGAATSHVIIDACASFYLAYRRGPGGERRAVRGFSAAALARRPGVGLLLSSTTTRESHEWEAFQAGVFSHEVRSGLYGAADADGDRRVSYREIAAFVARANESIANERFRPEVLARAPAGGDVLVNLARFSGRTLEIDPARQAHYVLESDLGVRIAELHGGAGTATRLHLPAMTGRVYLSRVGSGREYVLEPGAGPVALAALRETDRRVASRGPEIEAFRRIFELPFDAATVARFDAGLAAPPPDRERSFDAVAGLGRLAAAERDGPPDPPRGPRVRRVLGWTAASLALGLASGSALAALSARRLRAGIEPTDDQASVMKDNRRIASRNALAHDLGLAAFGVGVGATFLLLWRDAPPVALAPSRAADGATVSLDLAW